VNLRALRSRGGLLVAAVVGYVAAACVLLAGLVWINLAPSQRGALRTALGGQTSTLVLGGVLAVAGLIVLLANVVGRYPPTARRLAADTRLLLGPNPDHRLSESGPAELRELAEAVNELAERRRVAEREVERQVSTGRADVEHERNRLAAVMADLTVAVLVCSLGGRILLYNAAARQLLTDDPALGLGRSVFGIVDRGLLTHALDRIQGGGSAPAHEATMLRDGQLLQVRLAPVRGSEGEVTGFVLVLEDLTSRLHTSDRRDVLLRDLIETTRASLASIRAAIETVLDYPDMDPQQRSQFLEIVREESQRLGSQVEGWVGESAAYLGADWLLTDMRGEDLLTLLGRQVEREDGVATSVEPDAQELWVRVDSHAIVRAALHLVARLRDECSVRELTVSLTRAGRHAGLDLRWPGPAPDSDVFKTWADEPLAGGAAASVHEVVERHDGETWCGDGPDGTAYLRLLLPLNEAAPQPAPQAALDLGSRPELYDFDLFDLPEESLAWQDRNLGDLAYTVFDTETTGFHPDAGDEIVSVGAVRVVNGRLLRQETFERLVDPRRSVPARSVAVHGLTADMLRGQPTIDAVLPLLARFAEGTVLVGHNVGFDLSFLRLKEAQTGVRFIQPVLDTLLLDAALHPDHEHHTLEAIAARLGIGVVGRHTALGDALLTGEVFVGLVTLLQQRGIRTLGEALAAARATYQARLDASLYGR
jgi:DNA polymerase-3 subunit epsilon